jgi:hypothetical protein
MKKSPKEDLWAFLYFDIALGIGIQDIQHILGTTHFGIFLNRVTLILSIRFSGAGWVL